MEYNIIGKLNDDNVIYYIVYSNGKIIELTRNNNHLIFNDEKYIFLVNRISKKMVLHKVFDVNNKRFLTKSLDMQILYNKYNAKSNKEKMIAKKKILINA